MQYNDCVLLCVFFVSFCNLDIRSMVVPQTSQPKLT